MTNPAAQLAAIFEGWTYGVDANVLTARSQYARSVGMTEEAVVAAGMQALLLLDAAVEELTRQGFDMEPYSDYLRAWQLTFVRAAGAQPGNQLPTTRTMPIASDSFAMLKALGTLLDVNSGAIMPPASQVAAIEESLDEVTRFVQMADLNEADRAHLLGLLSAIRRALHDGSPGRLRQAVAEFLGEAQIKAATAGAEDERGRWAKIRDDFLTPFVIQGGAGLTGNVISGMITG